MQQLLDSEVDMEYDYYYRMVGINTSLSFFES